jgi:hypothetical protein
MLVMMFLMSMSPKPLIGAENNIAIVTKILVNFTAAYCFNNPFRKEGKLLP